MRVKIKEDITPVSAISAEDTIEDLYVELGNDLFDDANISRLKEVGLIDEDGYPVSTYEGFNGEIVHGRYTCEDIYENFNGDSAIDSPYIQNLFKKEIFEGFPEGLQFEYDDSDLPSIRDFSERFIKECFSGYVYESFWDNFDFSLGDCSYYVDDVPESVINMLEEKGFPTNPRGRLRSPS